MCMQDVKKFNNTDWEKGVRGMRAQRSGSKRGFMCSVNIGNGFLCLNRGDAVLLSFDFSSVLCAVVKRALFMGICLKTDMYMVKKYTRGVFLVYFLAWSG